MDFEFYNLQEPHWPQEGEVILANYDDHAISVYQAYRPAIAHYAVHYQEFGGEFSFNRMSWIKPNFLWMMFRSGWATKPDQERILEIRLRRSFFDALLNRAVASSYNSSMYHDQEAWQRALHQSEVRLQWDPDHDPFGTPTKRRALQLGLRGASLREFATTEPLFIRDITDFVVRERANLDDIDNLKTPIESIYLPLERIIKAVVERPTHRS